MDDEDTSPTSDTTPRRKTPTTETNRTVREEPSPRLTPVFPWLIAVAAIFFAVGLIANPWFEREVRTRLPWVAQEADLGSISARLDRQDAEIEAVRTRVAALEQRPAPLPAVT
ncbi:MAG: hypothetical protein WA906_14100, partial [Pacificimonas sp.]